MQNGTLHSGDVIIAGTAVGRVRTMRSDKGMLLNDAGPSTPVEITGPVSYTHLDVYKRQVLGDAGNVNPPVSQKERAVAEMRRPFALQI